jgi:hypothetical protein
MLPPAVQDMFRPWQEKAQNIYAGPDRCGTIFKGTGLLY